MIADVQNMYTCNVKCDLERLRSIVGISIPANGRLGSAGTHLYTYLAKFENVAGPIQYQNLELL